MQFIIHSGCIRRREGQARAVTNGPILAHYLPADATNTKRLYFPSEAEARITAAICQRPANNRPNERAREHDTGLKPNTLNNDAHVLY